MGHIIFVFAKGDKIKILNMGNRIEQFALQGEGFEHVATIDPCVYLENLYGLSDKQIIKSVRSLCKKS